jgi:branched-chain amino acid transport system permease protein
MQAFLDIFDIYLLEAVVNGILLGGVLALLALGLNLIFGVIDVTWICYAELVMIGMYGMYYLVQVFHFPYWAAAPLTIMLVAALGAALHYIVIAPLLTAPPINQLLATGGVLFILQSFALSASTSATSASACRCWRSARCISVTRGCCRLAPPWSAWSRSTCS